MYKMDKENYKVSLYWNWRTQFSSTQKPCFNKRYSNKEIIVSDKQ